jgi:hypothetical protein
VELDIDPCGGHVLFEPVEEREMMGRNLGGWEVDPNPRTGPRPAFGRSILRRADEGPLSQLPVINDIRIKPPSGMIAAISDFRT